MKSIIAMVIFILALSSVQCYASVDEKNIKKLIKAFQQEDRSLIASLITYPLKRKRPIPAIKDENELIKRFDQIFDAHIISLIGSSSYQRNWHQIGWRGISFSNGKVWINEDGKIRSISYESLTELKLRQTIIERDKASIHESIKSFDQPILIWETEKFRIRIDKLENASYRYASWSIEKQMNEKPDLIINEGALTFDGNGGNRQYVFKNGKYIYKCSVIVIGTSKSPPGLLEVVRGENILLSANVIKVLE